MDKDKLHILFLSGWFPSRVFPTNGDFVQRHAETIAIKHKVTLVHVVTDPLISKTEIVETKINNFKTIIAYVPKKNSLFKFFFFLKTYLKIIKKIGYYDLVHLNITYPKGLISLYLKLIKKKKYIVSEHWTDYEYPQNKSIGYSQKLISKIITKNASLVCPVSEKLGREMQDFGLKGKYKTIPNVVNTSIFSPDVHSQKTFTIVHVSNLYNPQKNVEGLLNVIDKLSKIREDFVLKIVGNADFSDTKAYLKNLSIPEKNIELISGKPQEDVAKILQQANVYISFSNYESFGLVIAESIACGTPVISTDTGIASEIKNEEFITVIPVKNEEKLLQSIVSQMEQPKTIDKQKMHEFIEKKYGKTVICNQFHEIYKQTLD